jgi:hypothetical protein
MYMERGICFSSPRRQDMEERILTQHPDPEKQGVNISKHKYDLIRRAIVDSIRDQMDITFKALTEDVKHRLKGQFEGSVSWYVTTVKLDLEARGVIERIPGSRPQRLRLIEREESSE